MELRLIDNLVATLWILPPPGSVLVRPSSLPSRAAPACRAPVPACALLPHTHMPAMPRIRCSAVLRARLYPCRTQRVRTCAPACCTRAPPSFTHTPHHGALLRHTTTHAALPAARARAASFLRAAIARTAILTCRRRARRRHAFFMRAHAHAIYPAPRIYITQRTFSRTLPFPAILYTYVPHLSASYLLTRAPFYYTHMPYLYTAICTPLRDWFGWRQLTETAAYWYSKENRRQTGATLRRGHDRTVTTTWTGRRQQGRQAMTAAVEPAWPLARRPAGFLYDGRRRNAQNMAADYCLHHLTYGSVDQAATPA